jgi:hypothetical protein
MKDEITIPSHFPLQNEENVKAAAKRREQYALSRDMQATENNEAIALRLAKEKEKEVEKEELKEEEEEEKKE